VPKRVHCTGGLGGPDAGASPACAKPAGAAQPLAAALTAPSPCGRRTLPRRSARLPFPPSNLSTDGLKYGDVCSRLFPFDPVRGPIWTTDANGPRAGLPAPGKGSTPALPLDQFSEGRSGLTPTVRPFLASWTMDSANAVGAPLVAFALSVPPWGRWGRSAARPARLPRAG